MLPIPYGRLLFSSAFIQCFTLANQLNHIFKAETKKTLLSSECEPIYMALETSRRQQRQSSKSSAIHPIRLQYKSFSSLSFLPLPLTPKTSGLSFRGKWCSSPLIYSLSQMQTMLAWFVANLNSKLPQKPSFSKSQAYNHLVPPSHDILTLLAQL